MVDYGEPLARHHHTDRTRRALRSGIVREQQAAGDGCDDSRHGPSLRRLEHGARPAIPGASERAPYNAALHGSRAPQSTRLIALRPAAAVGRAAEVSLTSKASRSASRK